jgi:hypothetical protein
MHCSTEEEISVNDKLRIELTPEERGDDEVEAISFEVLGGDIIVRAHWPFMDELYGDGPSIKIPRRIWQQGAAWIQSKL